ncbi:MAG: hypothetical protein RL637_168 [Pseudomonadota bacterium]|jgi:hypothetical protein
MKFHHTKFNLALLAAAMMISGHSYAASKPSSNFEFTPAVNSAKFSVRARGWSDPAFGDMGWTHSCKWGHFQAQAGQKVRIVIRATERGIHPGITVWYRGDKDTAPDDYVVDTFFPQNANLVKYAITDNDTGANLGDVVMKNVVYGYDADANSVIDRTLHPKMDGVNGKLVLNFTAPYTGNYMLVIGGFNPDPNIDATVGHDVDVTITVN